LAGRFSFSCYNRPLKDLNTHANRPPGMESDEFATLLQGIEFPGCDGDPIADLLQDGDLDLLLLPSDLPPGGDLLEHAVAAPSMSNATHRAAALHDHPPASSSALLDPCSSGLSTAGTAAVTAASAPACAQLGAGKLVLDPAAAAAWASAPVPGARLPLGQQQPGLSLTPAAHLQPSSSTQPAGSWTALGAGAFGGLGAMPLQQQQQQQAKQRIQPEAAQSADTAQPTAAEKNRCAQVRMH
jgi:hypothetical protein